MSRLVAVCNPHPGGTYIWFTVPDGPEAAAEAELPEAVPEPEAEI